MEKNYLVINLGSSSKRYSLFSETRELFSLHIEKVSLQKNYAKSTVHFFEQIKKQNISVQPDTIKAIAFRVVAPGSYFMQHRKITPAYLKKLQATCMIAPIHSEQLLHEIAQCKKIMPRVSYYGISDSAFHGTLPDDARLYGLPKDFAKKYDMYRFGYHGVSCTSILRKLKKMHGSVPKNIIICHLGGGSSITAVKNGKSIDTSMGFTPLEGVPMVTRCGNIDAAAILYLVNQGITLKKLIDTLFNQSGMVGLTERSDMRKIVTLAQQGDATCLQALEFFAYQIKKYIGAYHAVLGSIDLLVFTGGIGQNVPLVRSLVCKNLSSLGIELDSRKNNSLVDVDGFIQVTASTTKIAVVKNQEMHVLLHEMLSLINV